MTAQDALSRAGRYDHAERKRGVQKGRERGCWVYIAAVELAKAGFGDTVPYYRTTGYQRSRNAGSVIVSLYRQP